MNPTSTQNLVYVDHASTSFPTLFRPPSEGISWANPSNGHVLGQSASQAIEAERQRIAKLLNVQTQFSAYDSEKKRANHWV